MRNHGHYVPGGVVRCPVAYVSKYIAESLCYRKAALIPGSKHKRYCVSIFVKLRSYIRFLEFALPPESTTEVYAYTSRRFASRSMVKLARGEFGANLDMAACNSEKPASTR